MGFLEAGAPLSWEASARYREVVKRRGVREFLQLYQHFSEDVFPVSALSWGDEVEYCLLQLDCDNSVARLYLGAAGILDELKTREDLSTPDCVSLLSTDYEGAVSTTDNVEFSKAAATTSATPPLSAATAPVAAAPSITASSAPALAVLCPAADYNAPPTAARPPIKASAAVATAIGTRLPWQMSKWHPEYGAHMVEAIPGKAYPLRLDSILELLPSMQVRRKKVQAVLPLRCYVASMGSFPTMGAPERRPRARCCCVRSSPSLRRLRAAAKREEMAAERSASSVSVGAAASTEANTPTRGSAVAGVACHRFPAHASSVTDRAAASNIINVGDATNDEGETPTEVNDRSNAYYGPQRGAVAGARTSGAILEAGAAGLTAAAAAFCAGKHPALPTASLQEGEKDAAAFSSTKTQRSPASNCQVPPGLLENEVLRHFVEKRIPSEVEPQTNLLLPVAEGGRTLLAPAEKKPALTDEEQVAEREEQVLQERGRTGETAGQRTERVAHYKETRHCVRTEGVDRKLATTVTDSPPLYISSRVDVAKHSGDFAFPAAVPDPNSSRSRSLFVGDALINPHPRFGTLTANIRERRGKKVEILIPLFADKNTATPSRHRKADLDRGSHTFAAATAATGRYSRRVSPPPADREGTGTEGPLRAAESECEEAVRKARAAGGSDAGEAGRATQANAKGGASTEACKYAAHVQDVKDRSGRVSSVHAENTRREEALCRQLMLQGKILHDGKYIFMDAMGFGMGMHCVQATFGCPSMRDARYLYDQLTVLAPLWLALSAATPFMRGLLAATDSRWDVIAACVDCRTDAEKQYLPKSRYESVSLYISDEAPLTQHLSFYNDVPAPVNDRAFAALVKNGVDEILARHLAFLFVRDPLVIFEDKLFAKNSIRTRRTVETGIHNLDSATSALATPTADSHTSPTAATRRAVPSITVSSTTSPPMAATADAAWRATNTVTPTFAAPPNSMPCVVPSPFGASVQQRQAAEKKEEEHRGPAEREEEQGKHEDDASIIVAEAAIDWGADDGTVYTTTEDFENLQSTNWNSVRFKPPAAFKHIAPPSPPSSRGATEARASRQRIAVSPLSNSSCKSASTCKSSCRRWGSCGVAGSTRNFRKKATGSVGFSVENINVENREDGEFVLSAARLSLRDGHSAEATAGSSEKVEGECLCKQVSVPIQNERSAQAESENKNQAAAVPLEGKVPFTRRRTYSFTSQSASSLHSSSLSSSAASAAASNDRCSAPWRVEFRTPDVQLTDFENAACLSLVSVLVQVILEERLDLYLPMSLNDENKRRAVQCNSILRKKFWFRNDVRRGTKDRSFAEFSLQQILFGLPRAPIRHPSSAAMHESSLSSTRPPSAAPSPSWLPSSSCSFVYTSNSTPSSSSTSVTSVPPNVPACVCSPTHCALCFQTARRYSASSFSSSSPPPSPSAPSMSQLSGLPRSAGAFTASPSSTPPLLVPLPPSSKPFPRSLSHSCEPVLLHDAGERHSFRNLCAAAFSVAPSCTSSPSSCAFAGRPPPSAAPVSSPAGNTAALSVASPASPVLSSYSSCSPFVGLVPLCLRYIEQQVLRGQCSREAAAQYLEYFDFLRLRTEGLIPTDASFLRACLAVHPSYNRDSVIPARACFDFCQLAVKLGHGECRVPELFGPFAGRAGMRISADGCCFENGIPVVTRFFLSQYVSEKLKDMLRGCFVEVSGRGSEHATEQLIACVSAGEATGFDPAACAWERYKRVEGTGLVGGSTREDKRRVLREGDSLASPGGGEKHQEQPNDATSAAASVAGRTPFKEEIAATLCAAEDAAADGRTTPRTETALEHCKAKEEEEEHLSARDERLARKEAGDDLLLWKRTSKKHAPGRKAPVEEAAHADKRGHAWLRKAGGRSFESLLLHARKTTFSENMQSCTASLDCQLLLNPEKTNALHSLTEKGANDNFAITAAAAGSAAAGSHIDSEKTEEEEKPLTEEAMKLNEWISSSTAAAVCREPTNAGAMVGRSREAEAGSEVPGSQIARARGLPSTVAACTGSSPSDVRDGEVLNKYNFLDCSNFTVKAGNRGDVLEQAHGGDGVNERPEAVTLRVKRDGFEGRGKREGGISKHVGEEEQGTNAAVRSSAATAESKGDRQLQARAGPVSVPHGKLLIENLPFPRRAADGASLYTAREGDVLRSAASAAASSSMARVTQVEGIRGNKKYISNAKVTVHPPASEVAVGATQYLVTKKKADRRIFFALSGKPAASLCTATVVSNLRGYMLEPTPWRSEDTSNSPAASPAVGGGNKCNCSMYSGWPACAPVGVTNEEATGLWISLASGVHYTKCCDDTGSTSCPSTDDDRESADEVSGTKDVKQRKQMIGTYIRVITFA